ncbi:uncharacterized protein LOC134279077 [Saccostrea cucullata]|uniref:uncharacterized protein LOC134273560 n=1 Tax=Saccostrea cuccullata TaxID=36930 RepID=UPI002ED2CA7F
MEIRIGRGELYEKYTEKELLFEDIRTLHEEEEIRKEMDKKKCLENAKAVNLRKRAMERLSPEKAAGRSSSAVLFYIRSRSDNDRQVKREEMDKRREELRLERVCIGEGRKKTKNRNGQTTQYNDVKFI